MYLCWLIQSEKNPLNYCLLSLSNTFQPNISSDDNPNEKNKESLIIQNKNGGFKKIRLKKKVLEVEEIKLKIVEEKSVKPTKPCEKKFIQNGQLILVIDSEQDNINKFTGLLQKLKYRGSMKAVETVSEAV